MFGAPGGRLTRARDPGSRRTLFRVGVVAAVVSALVSVSALVGWATGKLALASGPEDFIPMAPATAAALLLSSTALLDRRHWRRFRRLVATLVALLALHGLSAGREHSGVLGRFGPFPLGVMSPVAACTLLLASAGLFALSVTGRRTAAAAFGLAVAAVGFLGLLGYAYGQPFLYGQESIIPLSLPSGTAFLALGIGLIAEAGSGAWPLRLLVGPSVSARMRRAFVPTVIVVSLAHGWLAVLLTRGPWRHPAVLAAGLATASVVVAALLVSRVSRKVGDAIEACEAKRRRAEEEHARLEERERATSALARQKDDLTRLVIHDLKNPLTTILMGVDLLAMRCRTDPRSNDLASDVRDAARSIDRMTLDVLDISRSEDGRFAPRFQPVDLPRLLEEVVRSVGLRASQHRTEVRVSSDLRDPHVEADPQLLRRVIENLLDNCLKYAPEGAPVEVQVHEAPDDGVEVEVRDRGPGVPVASREKIFEKYARLDRDSSKNLRESRGLGLAFCRLAVNAHGGRIWVEDNEPVGSRFRLRLPRSQSPAAKATEAARAVARSG